MSHTNSAFILPFSFHLSVKEKQEIKAHVHKIKHVCISETALRCYSLHSHVNHLAVLSNMVATQYMRLFKLIKIKYNKKFVFLVTLAAFQVLTSHMW